MAKETRYGIEVPSIPEDEPIILFRAQDKALVYLLTFYIIICEILGSPEKHRTEIALKRSLVRNWQENNPDSVKVPD